MAATKSKPGTAASTGALRKTTQARNKTQPTTGDIEAFLAGLDSAQRREEALSLIALMRKATGEVPVLWGPSIIGFGRRTYRTEAGREGETPLVAFSPRKAAMVLYVGHALATAAPRLAALGPHSTGKACLYLKSLATVDMAVLAELVAIEVALSGASGSA